MATLRFRTDVRVTGDILTDTVLSAGLLGTDSSGTITAAGNLNATSAPLITDDNTQGYYVGSPWFDVTNDIVYFCVDNSTGAAVWIAGGDSTSTIGARLAPFKVTTNATTSWTLNVDVYEYTITAVTHGKGIDPSVQVFEGLDKTGVDMNIAANGDVLISVSSSPDNRFAMTVKIKV